MSKHKKIYKKPENKSTVTVKKKNKLLIPIIITAALVVAAVILIIVLTRPFPIVIGTLVNDSELGYEIKYPVFKDGNIDFLNQDREAKKDIYNEFVEENYYFLMNGLFEYAEYGVDVDCKIEETADKKTIVTYTGFGLLEDGTKEDISISLDFDERFSGFAAKIKEKQ